MVSDPSHPLLMFEDLEVRFSTKEGCPAGLEIGDPSLGKTIKKGFVTGIESDTGVYEVVTAAVGDTLRQSLLPEQLITGYGRGTTLQAH